MATVLYNDRESIRERFGYRPMNGDPLKVETETEIEEPDSELHRLLPLEKQRWGVRIKSDNVPTRLKIDGTPSGKTWDYENFKVCPLVSERLKSLIERFEPSVHQFWPMPVENDQGEIVTMRYWFIICNRIDAFDRERSVPAIEGPRYLGLSGFGPKDGSRPVLRAAAIKDHHAWRDPRSPKPAPFISTALAEAMQAEGITGAAIFPIEEI